MDTSKFTVLGATLIGAVSVSMGEASFDLWDTMVGVVLVLALIAYGRPKIHEDRVDHWTFCAVFAFAVVITIGILVDAYVPRDINYPLGQVSIDLRQHCCFWLWLAATLGGLVVGGPWHLFRR